MHDPRFPDDQSSPDGRRGSRVLFDPSAYTPYEPPPRRRRWVRGLVTLIGLAVVVGVGIGAYATRDRWLFADEIAPLPPPLPRVDTSGQPEEPRLEPLTRPDLTGEVGSSLVLTVRATGPTGPVGDATVVFEVDGGEASVSPDRSRTDGRGVARADLTLPPDVGTVFVTARLVDSELSTRFSVRVLPGPPARIAGTQGSGQTAEVDELLFDRLGLVVTDSAGNPVPGVTVRFATSGGVVGPERVRTDSLGLASTQWRLGPGPGAQRLTATVEALDTILTFTATATARPVVTETRPPPPESLPVTVVRRDFVIGTSHVCALTGGVVSCRGGSVRGQGAATGAAFVSLASGSSHVCGLDPSGRASCWGANQGGQLGDGTQTDRESPVSVSTGVRFSTLAAGASHTCGLAGGGVPMCWGQNLNGQVGDGTKVDRRTPVAVGGGVTFTSLVAGWNHTCGFSQSGSAWCWGMNNAGQLGDGSQFDQVTPAVVRGPLESSLTAGAQHTCGLSRGQVLCWGANGFGQLGDGSTQLRAVPGPVEGLPGPVRQVVAGAVHTCALLVDGTAYCWGQNNFGQLGNGSTQGALTPTPVAGDLRFRSIHAGGALTCGFAQDGAQYCWGMNQQGQLGDGTRQSRSTPTPVG